MKGTARYARGLQSLGGRAALVAGQMALALVLLAGAGLMVRSGVRLYQTSIGVRPDHVLMVRLELPQPGYTPENGGAFFAQLLERVRALPGVESAALGSCVPVSGGCNQTAVSFPPAGVLGNGRDPVVAVHWISPDLLHTLGLRLASGRTFTDGDRAGQPKVVLASEAAVKRLWPNESPLGKRIALGQGGFQDGADVVGVVSDVRYDTIETAPRSDFYIPIAQSFQSRMRLFVRNRLDTGALAASITREVRALDPNLPVSEVKTMEERVGDAMWRTRIGAWLLSGFAALALLLTAIGIFGVMAQTVIQRTTEIGIRIALGAQRRDVLALVLRRAAVVIGAGLIAGVGGALGVTRLIASMLYGVEASDPPTFIAVSGLLAIVALVACYLPARRATRVDAVVALRSE